MTDLQPIRWFHCWLVATNYHDNVGHRIVLLQRLQGYQGKLPVAAGDLAQCERQLAKLDRQQAKRRAFLEANCPERLN